MAAKYNTIAIAPIVQATIKLLRRLSLSFGSILSLQLRHLFKIDASKKLTPQDR